MDSQRSKPLFQLASGVYFLMLAVYFVAARFPEGRIWGLNVWAYYPDWVSLSLLVFGIVVGVIVIRHTVRGTPVEVAASGAEGSDLKFILTAVGVTMVMGALFWLLRGRTHFLGDGHLLLSHLGTGSSWSLQSREVGESLIHIWVMKLFVSGGPDTALASYQFVSIASGLLFLTILLFGVRKLSNRLSSRLSMFLGISTGGYALLFFGYVENYSVFIMSILAFGITGILIANGRLNRWFAVPMVALSVWLHTLGVTLIPSAIYLLISGTEIEKSIARWRTATKVSIVLIAGLVGIALFSYFYASSYYFRFNIVSLYEDRFVADGYTILSSKHIADYCNLIVMLTPSFPILVLMLFGIPFRAKRQRADLRYLGILALSTLGAAFIFDPDLGMPRDWDMLSFVGVPLTLTIFYITLRLAERSSYARGTCWLAIMLNILVLGPRVVGQVDSEISLAHYTDYCRLDRARALSAHIAIVNSYRERGDTVAANDVIQLWRERYPERELLELAARMRDRGQLAEAFSLARQALRLDPSTHSVYSSLAESFFAARQIDSAKVYLNIAYGMRRGNPIALYNLGHIYYLEGNHPKASEFWKKSIYYDTTNSEPFLGLATLARNSGNLKEYQHYMERAVTTKDVTGAILKQLADLYYTQGRKATALRYYKLALEKGLPQETAEQLLRAFPQLSPDSL